MLDSALNGFPIERSHSVSVSDNRGTTIWPKPDEELLGEVVANQNQHLLAVAFASSVTV